MDVLIVWGGGSRYAAAPGKSREVFDVVSYPVDGIAMTIGGDALNESTIISKTGMHRQLL